MATAKPLLRSLLFLALFVVACYARRSNSTSKRVDGWVSQPNYRGTFDILWTCLVTIFISTYNMLCLNVPAPQDSFARKFGRRFLWMGLGILGPEFPLTYAAGQWSRAKHSMRAFHTSGYNDWHMRQAFFADMGGFVFHTRNSKPFPLNANQLHWLVTNNFVEYPAITREEIWDKSKQDTFTKIITAFQICYLVVQCIARASQNLAITTLELNALAIVTCSLMTSFVWLHKPADVQTSVHIYSSHSLSDITLDRPWRLTPLDFVDENGPGYSVNVQPFMRMPVIPHERPIQRIPNDRFPMNPYGIQEYFLCFATLLFTAIHVAGWNFDFPTTVEQLLWRISSLLLFSITVAFWVFETVASWTRLGRWKTLYLFFFNFGALHAHKIAMERKNTTIKRESAQLPLPWEFATIMPLAIIYGVAGLYLLGEAFAELRNIEGTAYVNVNWTDFIPHI
ncbi:hypothetical protein M501DRAFT_1010887 [Patellaria atrata CBS 101060]|uniref:Uncharacterized protein n=1 Tax=Patellaria atrata CBS 101060 TaxID=1346257 RepID=A0A9P4SC10_9PEZI|nr:hypothetical protein M501DRAFT_1010887 [Patellaria atrata CBS 101060]